MKLFCDILRPGDPPEYGYLYGIPAVALLGGYIATAMQVRFFLVLIIKIRLHEVFINKTRYFHTILKFWPVKILS